MAAAFFDHKTKEPRERFILIAIAAMPNSSPDDLAWLTGMTLETTTQALSYLMKDGEIYITAGGGYITQSAAVIA